MLQISVPMYTVLHSRPAMTSTVEDPGIPLVTNGKTVPKYTSFDGDDISSPTQSQSTRRGFFKRGMKIENVGIRLAKRKKLYRKRRILCDVALALGILGIILMILEEELYVNHVFGKDQMPSMLIKSFISASTFLLISANIWYHSVDIDLFMIDNSMDDWRLALTPTRVVKVVCETILLAIHPIPGKYTMGWTMFNSEDKMAQTVEIPVDVMLSLPMFFRLFLFGRALLLHSKLYTDASSQSLGALNRINFNFKLIFKLYMSLHPVSVLTILMTGFLLISAWAMRMCETYPNEVHMSYLDSMWVIAITFLTVGYGDIYPLSYCGRTISVLSGLYGAGCTALVVAVLARKLELSRAEKYVHSFVMDIELGKQQKHASADILKQAWFIFKARKSQGAMSEERMRYHQMKLFYAIQRRRRLRMKQCQLSESTTTVEDLIYNDERMHYDIKKNRKTSEDTNSRISRMENLLLQMETKLNEIHTKTIRA